MKKMLLIFLLICSISFSFDVTKELTGVQDQISDSIPNELKNVSQNMSAMNLTDYAHEANNFWGTLEEKYERYSKDPLFLIASGIIILLIAIGILRSLGGVALGMGEGLSAMVAMLSFMVLGLVIIIQSTGMFNGFEGFTDPLGYVAATVFVIGLGAYLLIKVFPR